jgi:hypothetical protein
MKCFLKNLIAKGIVQIIKDGMVNTKTNET